MKRRRVAIILAIAATIALGVIAARERLEFLMLTGRFLPIEKVDTLQKPVAVTGWTATALTLADGRAVDLRVQSLPAVSPALAEATRRGVEVDEDGTVWALVKIHHWCGNDPVTHHIARVDLSRFLAYLHIGESDLPVPEDVEPIHQPGGRFTDAGWDIGEYVDFENWQALLELQSAEKR
jgi:hypothetical protein